MSNASATMMLSCLQHRSTLLRCGLLRPSNIGNRVRNDFKDAPISACPSAWRGLRVMAHAAMQPPPQNYPIEQAGLSERQIEQLHTYLDYMLDINQVMNLTAVRDPEEAWQRHVGDSLALLPIIDKHLLQITDDPKTSTGTTHKHNRWQGPSTAVQGKQSKHAQGKDWQAGSTSTKTGTPASEQFQQTADRETSCTSSSSASMEGRMLRIIDVGTGAGLPGMVLAIARPHWKVTLLDSLRKRCDFLAQAAERAGLSNVDIVWSRAEDAGQRPDLREVHDIAVARAVAETRVLAELCLPFVRVGGLWVAAKGPGPQAEVDAAGPAMKKLGARLVALDMVDSYSADGQRTAVVAAKVAATPSKFPRRAGTPNAQPL